MAYSDGLIFFDHLERFLGRLETGHRFSAKSDGGHPIDIFVFANQPDPDCQLLITCGLSAHHLGIRGKKNRVIRMEMAICVGAWFDSKLMASLLLAVGENTLDRHVTPSVHGVLQGSGPVTIGGNPLFEHLYLTIPGYFPKGFDVCEAVSPPIHIVQLIPISSDEQTLIENAGWEAFEDAINEQGIDLMEFDQRKEVRVNSVGRAQ